MQLCHHLLDEESGAECESLNVREHPLRPFQIGIICNDNHALTRISGRFHAALHENIYTLAVVARSPRRVRVEAVEIGRPRKLVETVVVFGTQLLKPLFVSETRNGAANSLIKIE